MKTLIMTALVSALAMGASGLNFSGKWDVQVPDRRGRMQETTLTLNHVGNEVAGSFVTPREGSGSPASSEIWSGKVEGDTISFYIWTGRDQMVRMMYKGTMSGEQITFTVTGSPVNYNERGERTPPSGPQKVTAKRAK
jgi:hypothetical protein